MPRLFIGIEIPADIATELELKKGGIPGARWLDRECYHITLRFIGDVGEGTAGELSATLDKLDSPGFAISLSGVGTFGGSKPHSVYACAEKSAGLVRLQSTVERVCQMVGLEAEPRRFMPHVTLARLKGAPSGAVHAYLARHNLYRSRPFVVDRFVLFSSRPKYGGGPYRIEEAYGLRDVA